METRDPQRLVGKIDAGHGRAAPGHAFGKNAATAANIKDHFFVKASGKLPFELPSSWQAVQDQHPDVAKDSANPLYPYGAGLAY